MKKKWIYQWITILFLSVLFSSQVVQAKEGIEETLQYDEIQRALEQVLPQQQKTFSFSKEVKKILAGKQKGNFIYFFQRVFAFCLQQAKKQIRNFSKLLLLMIASAIFTNLSKTFQNAQVSKMSFYITYLIVFLVLIHTFSNILQITQTALNKGLYFMKVLLPTYFLSIAFCTGARTSMLLYETTFFFISILDFVLLHCILPGIQIYFILMLVNHIVEEDYFSKATQLLSKWIRWTLKTMLGVILGYHTIQAMLLPTISLSKDKWMLKAARWIPGIGGTWDQITKSIFGAGILVKNAIGIVGLLVLLMLVIWPIMQILCFTVVYQIGVAVVQPITDSKLLECMNGLTHAASLLLSSLLMASLLFFLTIALLSISTSQTVF